MDVTPIILGVALINVGVFLAGCTLALFRVRRERSGAHRAAAGAPAVERPTVERQLRHAGRRAH